MSAIVNDLCNSCVYTILRLKCPGHILNCQDYIESGIYFITTFKTLSEQGDIPQLALGDDDS